MGKGAGPGASLRDRYFLIIITFSFRTRYTEFILTSLLYKVDIIAPKSGEYLTTV